MNNDTLKIIIGIIALFLLITGAIIILFYIPNISFATRGIVAILFGIVDLFLMFYFYNKFKNKKRY